MWTWRTADEEEDEVTSEAGRAGLISVAVAFFLAELGDKTMLTTAGLAAARGAVPVWIGSFAAMLAATALAVLAGQSLTRHVRPATLRHVGAIAFAVVGTVTLAGAAAGLSVSGRGCSRRAAPSRSPARPRGSSRRRRC